MAATATASMPAQRASRSTDITKEAFGLWDLRAEDKITADAVPDWSPSGFSLPPGAPACRIDRMAWDQHDELAEMSVTHFDPNHAAYRARIP